MLKLVKLINRPLALMKMVTTVLLNQFHQAQRFTNFTKRSDSPAGGFGLVETVVGVAILTAVLLGLAQVGQFALRVVDASNLRLRASFLAEEGLEAVRILRDSSWAANIGPQALCTDYYLSFSGGSWQLTASPVPLVDAVFDRRAQFEAVNRNAAGDITGTSCSAGSDPGSRRVRVTVQWTSRGQTLRVAVSTYLTNLFGN